jgi:hypothetical protein
MAGKTVTEALKIKLRSCHGGWYLNNHLFSSKNSLSERRKETSLYLCLDSHFWGRGDLACALVSKYREGIVNATY